MARRSEGGPSVRQKVPKGATTNKSLAPLNAEKRVINGILYYVPPPRRTGLSRGARAAGTKVAKTVGKGVAYTASHGETTNLSQAASRRVTTHPAAKPPATTTHKAPPAPPRAPAANYAVNPSTGSYYTPGSTASRPLTTTAPVGAARTPGYSAPISSAIAAPGYKGPTMAPTPGQIAGGGATAAGSQSRLPAGTSNADVAGVGAIPQDGAAPGNFPIDPVNFGLPLPPTEGTSAQIAKWLKDATAIAGITYDPQINTLLREQTQAKSTATKNDATLKDMWGALAASIQQDAAKSQSEVVATSKTEAQRTADLTKNIGDIYNQSANQLTSTLQNLGMSDAAAASLAGMSNQSDFLKSLAGIQGSANAGALAAIGQGTADTARQYEAMAGAGGAQSRTDLMTNLSNLMYNTTGQISDLRGAKGGATTQLANQAEQNWLDRAYQRYNLGLNTKVAEENATQGRAGLALRGQEDLAAADARAQDAADKAAAAADKTAADQAAKGVTASPDRLVAVFLGNLYHGQPDVLGKSANAKHFIDVVLQHADDFDKTTKKHRTRSVSELFTIAHQLNSAAMAKKYGYKQVNTNYINAMINEAYRRYITGNNAQQTTAYTAPPPQ